MTATLPPALAGEPGPPEPEPILLEDVSWELYEHLLRELDNSGQRLYVTYDAGRMMLMAPRFDHETWKSWIGRMIEMMAFERDIPIRSAGSTTWKRRRLKKGLEPDECYYVANEPRIRGKMKLDFAKDPPPDLAVEVVVTHHPLDRHAVYAALKVPELWVYEGGRLTFTALTAAGEYHPVERSVAFPFLTAADVERFLHMFPAAEENGVLRAWRDWVRAAAPPLST